MTLLAAPAERNVTSHEVFDGHHVSPARTVEDGIRYIVESLDAVERQGDLFFGPQLLAEVVGPSLRVRFPLAIPTAQQASTSIDRYSLFSEGHYAVTLPTGEWHSHAAVVHAPGDSGDELYLAAWVLEEGALDRVESAGVTHSYAKVAWAVGIRTLDGLLEVWDDGVPTEYLLATDGAA